MEGYQCFSYSSGYGVDEDDMVFQMDRDFPSIIVSFADSQYSSISLILSVADSYHSHYFHSQSQLDWFSYWHQYHYYHCVIIITIIITPLHFCNNSSYNHNYSHWYHINYSTVTIIIISQHLHNINIRLIKVTLASHLQVFHAYGLEEVPDRSDQDKVCRHP